MDREGMDLLLDEVMKAESYAEFTREAGSQWSEVMQHVVQLFLERHIVLFFLMEDIFHY